MCDEQHDDSKSLRVVNPHSEIPVLHTPESLAGRPSSVQRKLPTPPLTYPIGKSKSTFITPWKGYVLIKPFDDT